MAPAPNQARPAPSSPQSIPEGQRSEFMAWLQLLLCVTAEFADLPLGPKILATCYLLKLEHEAFGS